MAWSAKYAAWRYFRRRGDVINKPRKMVTLRSYPPIRTLVKSIRKHLTAQASTYFMIYLLTT